MKVSHKNKKEIYVRRLIKECYKENVYSVIEASEKIGVSYSQLQEWAIADRTIAERLQLCREVCDEHAFSDGLTKKISEEKSLKYQCENNDGFKEMYEKEQANELRAKLEKHGKEIPPTHPGRIVMIEEVAEKAKELTRDGKKEIVSEKTSLPQKTLEDIETERINEWAEKEKRATPSFYLKQTITEDETGQKEVVTSREATGKNPLTHEQLESSLCAATGSANHDYALKLLTQIASGCFRGVAEDIKVYTTKIFNESTGVLLSLAPKDEIEGMLCARLLVIHDQAMNYMARASTPGQTQVGIDLNLNRATKLMRLYNETLDALNKHRRKGEQKVTVQHVNVNDGGQAIVNGHINQGEGERVKK